MKDLKVISIKDLLPITQIGMAGTVPPALDIRGHRFNQASQVFINDIPSPEFMVVSDVRIIAQIPSGQETSAIKKLQVLAESPSTDRKSIIHFEMGRSFKGLQGIERMVQTFCKLLLQTPGSDKFQPTIGGGLLTLVGQNVERGATKSLQASVVSSVSRTKDQLVALQNRNPRIPADEKLLSAETEGVGFNPNTTTLMARVLLVAQSGQRAVANLTF